LAFNSFSFCWALSLAHDETAAHPGARSEDKPLSYVRRSMITRHLACRIPLLLMLVLLTCIVALQDIMSAVSAALPSHAPLPSARWPDDRTVGAQTRWGGTECSGVLEHSSGSPQPTTMQPHHAAPTAAWDFPIVIFAFRALVPDALLMSHKAPMRRVLMVIGEHWKQPQSQPQRRCRRQNNHPQGRRDSCTSERQVTWCS